MAAFKIVLVLFLLICGQVQASEVLKETDTRVVMREHTKTGEPYVSIVSTVDPPREDLLSTEDIPYPRPDYRMLQKDVSPKDVGYQGPYSSRKKVYIFAASMAALGTAGAVTGAVAFPAAAGVSTSGAGMGAAGTAVAAGTVAATSGLIATDQNLPEDFVRQDETQLVETGTDFYRIHVRHEK